MDPISIGWILVYLGLGAILLELIIGIETGFDLVLIGIALMIGGGVANMTDNWVAGVAVTAALTIIYIFVGRHYVKKKLSVDIKRTNVDKIKDKKGTVTKTINPYEAGQVKIGTEVWRAVADKTINIGTRVTVEKVKGVTARVV